MPRLSDQLYEEQIVSEPGVGRNKGLVLDRAQIECQGELCAIRSLRCELRLVWCHKDRFGDLCLSFTMVMFLDRRVREDLRSNRIRAGNCKRLKLQVKYFEDRGLCWKHWTEKGAITRMYGQGAQNLFSTFPKFRDVAVSGSVGVAIYDVMKWKKDLHWMPDKVDVFVAVPHNRSTYPLGMAFPVMIWWLDNVRSKRFDYVLASHGAKYGGRMLSFEYTCRNAKEHSFVVPKVMFTVTVAGEVRDICDKFELSLSAPILGMDRHGSMKMKTNREIRRAFRTRRCYCRYQVLDERARACIDKYERRGFECHQVFSKCWYWVRSDIPKFGGFRGGCPDPVPRSVVLSLLGRKPTLRETKEFLAEAVDG